MKKNLVLASSFLLLAACSGPPLQAQGVGAEGKGIRASFRPQARPQPNVGLCDNQDQCGIHLEEDTGGASCALRPSEADRIVVIRRKQRGKPVEVSWYIPVQLQHRYRFDKDDGITFKDAQQKEFAAGKVVSEAEYAVTDRFTDKTRVYAYTIQVTGPGNRKCVYDPGLVNDW